MGLWEFLGGISHRPTTGLTSFRIKDENVDVAERAGVRIQGDQHYLQIWLREMCLRDDRVWFTNRAPLVHSVAVLKFGDQSVELSSVAGKSTLQMQNSSLNRSAQLNFELTGRVPFRGGSVQFDCGLNSIQLSNIIEKFTNVVSEFAAKLAQPQVSAAVSVAGSIANGVQSLLGAGESEPKLYYRNTFTDEAGGEPLRSGFFLLSEKAHGSLSPDQAWVKGGRLHFGSTLASAQPADPHDYLLIEIAALEQRDDVAQFSQIAQPFQEALSAKLVGDMERAQQSLIQARIAAFRHPDLTGADKRRVIAAMNKEFSEFTGAFELSAPAIALRAALRRAPTIAEARELPEPNLFEGPD